MKKLNRTDWENKGDSKSPNNTPTKSPMPIPQNRGEMAKTSAATLGDTLDELMTHIPKGIHPDFGNKGVKNELVKFLSDHPSCSKMSQDQLDALASSLKELFKEKFEGKRMGVMSIVHYAQDHIRGWQNANCG